MFGGGGSVGFRWGFHGFHVGSARAPQEGRSEASSSRIMPKCVFPSFSENAEPIAMIWRSCPGGFRGGSAGVPRGVPRGFRGGFRGGSVGFRGGSAGVPRGFRGVPRPDALS